MTQRLFVRVDESWDQDSTDELLFHLDEVTPDDVRVIVTPDSVEYLGEEQIRDYVDRLVEALTRP